ncbi:aspartate racemase [Sphaerotilus hippei]|uniref:Aspartate racemase n=1 Tax=Sphaerotilus hippei TaxID=744406 RepID=A0A318H2L4_9BURK|nr:amino acid racemase [Sphaerotilus hippei]PXW97483.1 aspartate racemase [Sphaerotilus hippei]
MPCIGVLGGMGPAATVDFMAKLVALTPARRDQDHLPMVVANLPQVPDRSAAILGRGPDPLPSLQRGIDLLNHSDVGVVVIPCNSSHHWYAQLSASSQAPILHIAQACVRKVPDGGRTCVLATRGALASGFYQRELAARGIDWEIPDGEREQPLVDETIRLVKAGQPEQAGRRLQQMLAHAHGRGVEVVIMACTELPLAASHADTHGLLLIDSTLELARSTVDYALHAGWNHC